MGKKKVLFYLHGNCSILHNINVTSVIERKILSGFQVLLETLLYKLKMDHKVDFRIAVFVVVTVFNTHPLKVYT